MSDIKTKIVKTNVKEVLESLNADQLGRAVMAGALVLETAVKVSMSATSHSGRKYGRHQASAPGETPAVDTGNLVNSIRSELVESTDTNATANVSTGVEYAAWLEFGTSKMKARPYMRRGYDENEGKIIDTVKLWAKRQIDGATR